MLFWLAFGHFSYFFNILSIYSISYIYLCFAGGTDADAGTRLYQALLEANMATEVGLVTLDALGLYCIHMKESLLSNRGDNPIMNKIFDILLSFLQVGQSETLFRHVFAALRALINNFSTVLFQGKF